MTQLQDFHNFARGRLHSFTGREWLVNRVRAWRADETASRVLVIFGGPGVGKSAFAAHLWLDLQMVDAAHFCIAGQGGTIEPLAFVRSLGEQLAAHVPSYGQALADTEIAYDDRRIFVSGTVSVDTVQNGAEVAGVRVANLHLGPLPPEQAFDRVIRQPLRALANADDLPPLTLLIDALDEAATYCGGPGILGLLTKADDLPPQVRFLLTTRAEPQVETWFHGVPREAIDTQGDQNRDDVRRYLVDQLATRSDLQTTAERHGWNATRFTETVGTAAEWNFLYLTLALDEIARGKLLQKPGDVLPASLNGFYTYLLNSRIGPEAWRDWGADLLEIILALKNPVGLEQVADLLGWSPRQTMQRLQKAAQLLDASLFEQGRYWRAHWSVAQFMADQDCSKAYWLDLAAGHSRIAEYYLTDRVHWSQHDGYSFRHLSNHLVAAEMFAELGDLIERRDWYEAQRDYDPTLNVYVENVNQALALAETRGLGGLPQVVAWSLLSATIHTRATEVPMTALEAMAMLGEGERALRYVELIMGLEQQVSSYLRIAEQVQLKGQDMLVQKALQAALAVTEDIGDEWRRVRALTDVVPLLALYSDQEKAKTVLRDSILIAERISDEERRSWALSDIAKALAQVGDREGLQRLLSTVNNISNDRHGNRTRILSVVAQALAQMGAVDQAREVLQAAISAAEIIADGFYCAYRLSDLAQVLAQMGETSRARDILQTALAAAGRHVHYSAGGLDVRVLINLARVLAQIGERSQAHDVLQTALAIAKPKPKHDTLDWESAMQALVNLIPVFTQQGMDSYQAVQAASEVLNEEMSRVRAQNDMTQEGQQVDLPPATSVTINDWSHVQALSEVAQVLVQMDETDCARDVLQEALVEAEGTDDKESRSETLDNATQALAQALALANEHKGLQRLLVRAEGITNELTRAQVLSNITQAAARMGDRETLQHVLANVTDIRDDQLGYRAQVLSDLARAFAQVGDMEQARDALQAALTAAEHIIGYDPFGGQLDALQGMAQAMVQVGDRAGLQRVLAVTWGMIQRTIERSGAAEDDVQLVHEYSRSFGLLTIAHILAKVGEVRQADDVLLAALADVESIRDEEHRGEMLDMVAQSLAEVGDFEHALVAARCIGKRESRVRALSTVTQAIAEANDVELALAAAGGIDDERERARALVMVTHAMARLGRFGRALATAERIRDGEIRAQALSAVAQAMAQAGDVERALETAERIRWEESRNRALSAVAQAMAQAGDVERALATAGRIQDKQSYRKTLGAVAQALAQTSNTSQALVIANGIDDEWGRASSLAGIAEILAQASKLNQARDVALAALAIAEGIADNIFEDRGPTLTAITQALAQAGEFGQALAIADSIADSIHEGWRRALALEGIVQHAARKRNREDLMLVLTAAKYITNRAHELSGVAQAVAEVTCAGDEQVAGWVQETFASARVQGRDEVFAHIATFAPVLAKLGISSATWDHLQAVEAVLSGESAPPK